MLALTSLRRHLLVLTALVGAALAPTAQADVGGLWLINGGDAVLLLADDEAGVFGAWIGPELGVRALYGSATDGVLSLDNVAGNLALDATYAGDDMLGSASLVRFRERGSSTVDFVAERALAYAGSAFDGVWDTSLDTVLIAGTARSGDLSVTFIVELAFDEDGYPVLSDVYSGVPGESSVMAASPISLTVLSAEISGDAATGTLLSPPFALLPFTAERRTDDEE